VNDGNLFIKNSKEKMVFPKMKMRKMDKGCQTPPVLSIPTVWKIENTKE